MDIDVIIIGAGPAGLEAAIELSKAGKKVTLLESRKSMEVLRRACSMQLVLDDDYEGEGVILNDEGFVFPKSGFTVPYHGKRVPIYNKYYHSPKNHVMRFANENGKVPFSYKFDKRALLLELYNACLSLGVDVCLGARAHKAVDNGDSVTVTYKTENNEVHIITAAKLIDAEGVNAFICRKLGMNRDRPYIATALCVKYIYENLNGIEPNSWNLYYGKAFYSNAAVIIGPSIYDENTYEVTITSDKNNLSDWILFDLVNDSPLSGVFKGSHMVDKMSCVVRAYMPLLNPCANNAIIIGDAAAFVEVETQGALLCGYHAAQAVLKELEGQDGWTDYTEWWQTSFEFNGPDYMKVSQGYALVPVYTDDEIDYLFALAEPKCMKGTYSQYKTPLYMWENILSHDEQIKVERPELYAKIQRMDRSSLKDSFR